MKIVFTTKGNTWNSKIDPRFGRADMFLVYDEELDTLTEVLNNETESMEHGAGLQTSKKVLGLNADIIITGNGAGQKALEILKSVDAKMYVGAGDMSVEDAYKAYKENKLTKQF
ncbi:MAG: NifB/NifX family molybdenum-iron cluster-binding protein [Campylobacterota bacterium]|nr:NifB/NifX family molybdenum-iron cluster-binding protein [Campylobacterota bacterium]